MVNSEVSFSDFSQKCGEFFWKFDRVMQSFTIRYFMLFTTIKADIYFLLAKLQGIFCNSLSYKNCFNIKLSSSFLLCCKSSISHTVEHHHRIIPFIKNNKNPSASTPSNVCFLMKALENLECCLFMLVYMWKFIKTRVSTCRNLSCLRKRRDHSKWNLLFDYNFRLNEDRKGFLFVSCSLSRELHARSVFKPPACIHVIISSLRLGLIKRRLAIY